MKQLKKQSKFIRNINWIMIFQNKTIKM
jgi:hypothetical protein